MFDPLEQAVYATIHEYPGGAVRLAPRVGMNAGTLSNKANPAMESHQLSLRESIPIQRVTGDCRILEAYAGTLDHVAVPLGDFSDCSDLELLERYAHYHAEVGETAVALYEALADRRVRRHKFQKVRSEFLQDVRAGLELLSRLEALVDE